MRAITASVGCGRLCLRHLLLHPAIEARRLVCSKTFNCVPQPSATQHFLLRVHHVHRTDGSAASPFASLSDCDDPSTEEIRSASPTTEGVGAVEHDSNELGEDIPLPVSGSNTFFTEASGHYASKRSLDGQPLAPTYKTLGTDSCTRQPRWFPYLDQFEVKGVTLTSAEVKQMLSPLLQNERKNKIDRVVANRTYSVCPVIEGLLDLGNIAAVLRSADALGFQSVHVISNDTSKRYKKTRKVSMGSEKWLDVEISSATKPCFAELRARGYRIAVASVTDGTVSMLDMDWTIPTAIVFGNEMCGVSAESIEMTDIKCSIPMTGMVDSFNVSVAAGIIMHHAVRDRMKRLGAHGDLSPEEQEILCADFYLRHSSQTLSVLNKLVEKKRMEFIANNEKSEQSACITLKSVLRGELEADAELPDYLKVDLEKVDLKAGG